MEEKSSGRRARGPRAPRGELVRGHVPRQDRMPIAAQWRNQQASARKTYRAAMIMQRTVRAHRAKRRVESFRRAVEAMRLDAAAPARQAGVGAPSCSRRRLEACSRGRRRCDSRQYATRIARKRKPEPRPLFAYKRSTARRRERRSYTKKARARVSAVVVEDGSKDPELVAGLLGPHARGRR